MAEQTSRDVVEQAQSVGDLSLPDVPATTTKTQATDGEERTGSSAEEEIRHQTLPQPQDPSDSDISHLNGNLFSGENMRPGLRQNELTSETAPSRTASRDGSQVREDSILDDGTGRSDTDGSRADGSVTGDDKSQEHSKPAKRFPTAKPVSFAKYSVPGKTIAPNGTVKLVAEKVPTPGSATTPVSQIGRPRLVAKTTTSLQQKAKPFKSAAPDPMQVWNKNRVTPQPSTKHLTDEELKQQYGIHMTSRMQDDGEGKEAKWADIDDDDEDDWAPTTIEWTDGTKSTVPPAEVISTIEKKAQTDAEEAELHPKPVQPSKILTSQFTSSVGPNATVLKLGAGRQQAQKSATQQSNNQVEKSAQQGTKTNPAPTPAKSPWALLPPVDKVSPIAINPQMAMPPPPQRYPSGTVYNAGPTTMTGPSPAKEISADDFSRSWRENTSTQSRELYMPNSGKYEAVPENRRRMSKNEQNFRKPAVLQRPSQSDPHAPAEPSAAFQTSRTSMDQGRRRASSSISGGSVPFPRRASVSRSSDAAPVFVDTPSTRRDSVRPESQEGDPSQLETPTYQARGGQGSSYFAVPAEQGPMSDGDLEASRAQQRLMMKEKIEQARKRKQEEEARLEAEKQERIKLKLASLGPIAPSENNKAEETPAEPVPEPAPSTTVSAQSPPKPPLPLATGEPQQYGMMKVHPMDSVKRTGLPSNQQLNAMDQTRNFDNANPTSEQHLPDLAKLQPPITNGIRAASDSQRPAAHESFPQGEKSPRINKAISVGPEARAGWGDLRNDHRTPPSANLWGLPNNKALGNGTFDRSLGDYGSQSLSAQNPSYGAQGWMNGRTSVQDKSPSAQYASNLLPEGRSPLLSTIPLDQQSLAADSEADSLQPISKSGPIGPPQAATNTQSWQSSPNLPHTNTGIAAWNNFHQHTSQQERAESERVQRELAARREEELRTGVKSGPQYTFNETWKQVQLGDQAGQRHVSGVAQSSIAPSGIFSLGSTTGPDTTARHGNGTSARGSRFFPPSAETAPAQSRRAVTYGHQQTPGSPSPPPAEEYASLHPAFDGDYMRPIVHFPREKAVVKLPPATKSPSPPAQDPSTPLSWAARVSQPVPQPSLRAVSTPIAQTPSWQARFDGLLRKQSPTKHSVLPVEAALAVASSSREPWDVLPSTSSAAVSLPQEEDSDLMDDWKTTSKDVEGEEDLFEDREAGSLPIVRTPRDGLLLPRLRGTLPPALPPSPIDAVSVRALMLSDHLAPPIARVYLLGMTKPVTKTVLNKDGHAPSLKSRNTATTFGSKNPRTKGPKSRSGADTHIYQSGTKSRQASGTHSQSQTPSQGQHSGSSTQPASPKPSGNHGSQHSTPPASQTNGHARAPRNHVSHSNRGWKGKQAHLQPQAQVAH